MSVLDKALFKEALARFATGVTVVTTRCEEQDYGITVSSFGSVSLEPTLVLICIAKTLFTHSRIEQSGVFAVNILEEGQLEWGERFAGRIPELEDRFEGIPIERGATGSPLLPGCLAWVDCEVRHSYDGGDHTIFVGEVRGVGVGQNQEPLLYFNRHWGRIATEGPDAGSSWPGENKGK
jgi:flavin reductase